MLQTCNINCMPSVDEREQLCLYVTLLKTGVTKSTAEHPAESCDCITLVTTYFLLSSHTCMLRQVAMGLIYIYIQAYMLQHVYLLWFKTSWSWNANQAYTCNHTRIALIPEAPESLWCCVGGATPAGSVPLSHPPMRSTLANQLPGPPDPAHSTLRHPAQHVKTESKYK